MSNPFDLLFLDEDGAPVVQTVTKKPFATAPTTTTQTKKTQSTQTTPKGRMDGDRKGKEAGPQTVSPSKGPRTNAGEDSALPDRPNRGAAQRGGRRPAPPANRNFDRHSRDGRKPEGEKRQFSGKGNWGNPADAAEANTEASIATEATVASPVSEQEETVASEEQVAENPYMTLEQFLAEQEKKKPAVSAPAARAANDGAKVDGEVVKETDDMFFITAKGAAAQQKNVAAVVAGKKEKSANKFSLQELNAVVPGGLARPPRPIREEREDRRGPKSGRAPRLNNKDNNSHDQPKNSFVNIKDSESFPSL